MIETKQSLHLTLGLHYAVRIFIGTVILWLSLEQLGDTNSLWAIITLIGVTEPLIHTAWPAFLSRVLNTVIGCVVGFLFLLIFGNGHWLLPVSLTVTVLISTLLTKVSQGWKVAPITTAIIVSAGMMGNSVLSGLNIAIHRTMEVFLGSVTALIITFIMSGFWVPKT